MRVLSGRLRPLSAQDALRRDIWLRVFRYHLMPPRPVLHRLILERDALGTELWDHVMRPALVERAPALFADPVDPALARVAMDLRRVGATAYALAGSLYYLHGTRPEVARRVGVAAMWLAQAAAVMDYLLDEELLPPAALAAHFHADALQAALPWPHGAPTPALWHFDSPPHEAELIFVLIAAEQGFASLRACLAQAADDAYHRELYDKILACLQAMVAAELSSPALHLGSAEDLERVEATLRRVNTLSVWLSAYVGLVAEPAAAPEVVDAVTQAAGLVGDIGWTLDALEDVLPDLRHQVWNRAWLALARAEYGQRPDAWKALIAAPAQALAGLSASTVFDQLLGEIEAALAKLDGSGQRADGNLGAILPAAARQQLADVCRLLVWSFLVPSPAVMDRDRGRDRDRAKS